MPNGWGSGTHVKLEEVEGIGPKNAQRLRKAGVRSLHGLLMKGAKPGDMPIELPSEYELVVNLKTAKALGLTIPQSILLQASRVIE